MLLYEIVLSLPGFLVTQFENLMKDETETRTKFTELLDGHREISLGTRVRFGRSSPLRRDRGICL